MVEEEEEEEEEEGGGGGGSDKSVALNCFGFRCLNLFLQEGESVGEAGC